MEVLKIKLSEKKIEFLEPKREIGWLTSFWNWVAERLGFVAKANHLVNVIQQNDTVKNRAESSLKGTASFSPGRFRQLFRDTLARKAGTQLANMERPPLEFEEITQEFFCFEDDGNGNFRIQPRQARPTAYIPAKRSPGLCNLRLVHGLETVTAFGSVPNSERKVLEAAILIYCRHAKNAGGLSTKKVHELPFVVHSYLSASALQPAERKMTAQERAALEWLSNRVVEIGEVRVQFKPIFINTQSNVFSRLRNTWLARIGGYSHSDEISQIGLNELAKLVREKQSQNKKVLGKLEELLKSRDGRSERLEPLEESQLIHELAKAAGAAYYGHCKSACDRAAAHLAGIMSKGDKDKFGQLMSGIFRWITWMSTGINGLKYGSGRTQNPITAPYLPDEMSVSDLTGASQLRGS